MCRRLIIELRWDDEHAEHDAGMMFQGPDFDSLTLPAEAALLDLLEGYFLGKIDYKVEPLF